MSWEEQYWASIEYQRSRRHAQFGESREEVKKDPFNSWQAKRPFQGEPSNLSSFFGWRKDSNSSFHSKTPMMEENVAKSFDD